MQGCAPVYIPNAPVVFTNEKQGDVSVAVRQGAFSTNVQGGYAVTENINVGANISALYTGEGAYWNTTYDATQSLEIDLIAGYYSKFTSSHLFQINAGVGKVEVTKPSFRSQYFKGYLQPSLTFLLPNNRSQFTVITRLLGTTYADDEDGVNTVYNAGYIEPMIDWSIGDKFQFRTQLGVSIPLSAQPRQSSSPVLFNIGIGYRFSPNRGVSTLP